MSLAGIADIAAAFTLLGGALLTLIAAIGMLRFPDLLSRMHPATKPQVLGLLLVVLGLALRLREPGPIAILFLVAVAQMATIPIASHMIARTSFRAGQVSDELLVVNEAEGIDFTEHRGAP